MINVLLGINLTAASNYVDPTEIHLGPDYKLAAAENAQVWWLLALIMAMIESTILWLSPAATKVWCSFAGVCYIPLMTRLLGN